MAQESPSTFRQSVTVLRAGPYRRYMTGEVISMIGTWMQVMAQGWVMTTLTSSAFMLGLVNFAGGMPMMLLTMYGGTVADRFDKRWILMVTQVVQIVLAVGVGLLVQSGQIHIWHIVVAAMLLGIANAFEMPAASALVPELVEKDEIRAAIAFDRVSFHSTRLIGPAAAGYMVGLWGAAAAFYANAFSFVALMVALMTIAPRPIGTPEEEEQRSGGMKAGIVYVRSDRPTLAMIALVMTATILVFPLMVVMMPLYATHELSLPPERMGTLMAVSGIGSLVGTIGLLNISRSRRIFALSLAAAGITAGLLLLSWARQFYMAVPALVLLGISMSTVMGLANTTVQERAPNHLRGRVSAIFGITSFGLMPLTSLLMTGASDLIGMRHALFAAACLFALTSACVLGGPARLAFREPIVGPGEPVQQGT